MIERIFQLFVMIINFILGIPRMLTYKMGTPSDVTTSYSQETNEEFQEISDTDDEGEASKRMNNLGFDAVGSFKSSITMQPNFDILSQIEDELEEYEKISLIFLLYDDSHVALQNLVLLKEGSTKKFLHEWGVHENKHNEKWEDKLLEALAIIQNFCLLKKLGCPKDEADVRFLPYNITSSLTVNKIKKCLYRLFEDLEENEVDEILKHVKKYFNDKNLEYREYDRQLETLFTYWLDCRYITLDNLTNFNKAIKVLNKDAFYDELSKYETAPEPPMAVPSSSKTFTNLNERDFQKLVHPIATRGLGFDQSAAGDATSLESYSSNLLLSIDPSKCYPMNKEKPGILLIINQKYFFPDLDDENQHLVVSDRFEDREGSEKDVQALKSTFEHRGFMVIVKDNLQHDEMDTEIVEAAKTAIQYSSFFVCILSHGRENEVFSVNQIPIKIKYIKELICKHYVNKPKVLLLQTCQGNTLINIKEDNEENLTTDGGANPKMAPINMADLLVFCATIPGYAAVRDRKRGSWFIQTLCKKIETNSMLHLYEICMTTQDEVMNYKWKDGTMISEVNTTFRKRLYLPERKQL